MGRALDFELASPVASRRFGFVRPALFVLTAILVGGSAKADGDAVLIEFTSAFCGPCRAMQPVLDELARSGVALRSVDVNREPTIARRYGVEHTPTFVVVSGGKELTRLVGIQTVEQLRQAISTDRNGPWFPTTSQVAVGSTPAHDGVGNAAIDSPPNTRLAPLPSSLVAPAVQPPRGAQPMPRSEVMPSVSLADAIQRAEAATVRLRVHDGQGHGVGTGTIIDTHGEEALVLTCGHLFRDTKGQGRIEVDLFVGGEPRTIEGQLIDYDADDRDIALVAIRPGFQVAPVRIANPARLPSVGDTAFSFGCDRGDNPSRRDTRVTGINKYNQHKRASNLEIAGAPIDGRSGGGLFDADGRLVGVCNAADYEGDIGIYAGPGAIQWQLERLQLQRLYLDHSPPADGSPNNESVANASTSAIAPNHSSTAAAGVERLASLQGGRLSPAINHQDAEVIVIIRDRGNPATGSRVVTLTQPSEDLLRIIESQAAR